MSKSSKARNRPRRVVGVRLLGPPRAKRSPTAGLSVFPLRKLLVPLFMVAALVLWAPAAPIAAGRSEPISVAYCIDCVPFQFQGEDGKPAGLIIDIWRLWSEKSGIEIDFRPGLWDETLSMVINGEVEAHAGLFYSEQRAPYLEYGRYLTTTDTNAFLQKGLAPIDQVEDLAAYKVGVLAFDFVEKFLEERLPKDSVIVFESYDAIMNALRDGRLRVFAADTPTGIYHLQRAGLGFDFEYSGNKPLYTTDWQIAAAKGNTGLIQIINQGLAQITRAERREIERRWIAIEAKDAN